MLRGLSIDGYMNYDVLQQNSLSLAIAIHPMLMMMNHPEAQEDISSSYEKGKDA